MPSKGGTMTARTHIVSTLVVIMLALPLHAVAADTPCSADIQKLRAGAPASRHPIQACLKQHESQLSDACRKRIDALAQEVKELALVCRFDIGRLCADVTPGAGKLVACLNDKASDLSPECKAAMD